MYLNRRRRVLSIALVLVLLPSTFGYGPCNKQKSLSVAAEAAKDIGGGTRDVIKAVGEAFDEKLITLEQKDKLADLLGNIARGGQKGVAAIDALEKAGVTTLSGADAETLSRVFTDDVVAPFLQLLTELGKLSDSSSAAIRAALVSVRTAIVLLSSRIGRADIIREIRAREVWNA